MRAALEGIRVLVVEDEFLVATLIEDMLVAAGCVVAGPIPRLSKALDAVGSGTFDAAVLDVNLAAIAYIRSPTRCPGAMSRSYLSPATARVCCRANTRRAPASASRSRWRICSTSCRASSPLPALRREPPRQPSTEE